MATRVEVRGARRLAATLRRAGVQMNDLKRVNKDAADVVARSARAAVPVRSGRLAASIRTAGTQSNGVIRAGRKSVPYAGPIHWGWPARNIRPVYFLSDPARATEPVWLDLYENRTNDLLDNVRGL